MYGRLEPEVIWNPNFRVYHKDSIAPAPKGSWAIYHESNFTRAQSKVKHMLLNLRFAWFRNRKENELIFWNSLISLEEQTDAPHQLHLQCILHPAALSRALDVTETGEGEIYSCATCQARTAGLPGSLFLGVWLWMWNSDKRSSESQEITFDMGTLLGMGQKEHSGY